MTTTLDSRPPADSRRPADSRSSTDAVVSPTQTLRPRRLPARFAAAWRSEWVKLATVRSPRVIAALTALVGGFAAFAVARLVTDEEITVANVFGFSAVFTAVFAAVSGILIHTADAEHHTITQTFAAQPRRSVVVAAKAATLSAFSVMLGLSGLAAGAIGAWLGGVEAGDTSTIPATMVWATGFTVLAAILGLGIGLIARQSAAAISGVLVWWLVVENLFSAFAPERVVRFMPFVAGNGMLEIVDDGERIAFDRPITTVIFGGYALAALLVGLVVVHRSDP